MIRRRSRSRSALRPLRTGILPVPGQSAGLAAIVAVLAAALTRRSAHAATALEIGLLTGTAALVAAVVALPASALVLARLDPVPTLLPQPLFTVPWGSLVVVLAGVVGVTVGGALLVGRAARRAVAGEVLREAP